MDNLERSYSKATEVDVSFAYVFVSEGVTRNTRILLTCYLSSYREACAGRALQRATKKPHSVRWLSERVCEKRSVLTAA